MRLKELSFNSLEQTKNFWMTNNPITTGDNVANIVEGCLEIIASR